MNGRILPDAQAHRARAFVSGTAPVAVAVPAATVVLLRDHAGGLEVYVHRRHTAMEFAGGMIAFPGGRVDDADTSGATLPGWVDGLDADPAAARAFVRAALRETLEETGVRLEPESLVPWARWVTPRFEPRRYDTWFFLAQLPGGQRAEDVSGEADHVQWISPQAAIEGAADGDLIMLPPTYAVLAELAGYGGVADALAAGTGRVVETVLPGWVDDGHRVRSLLPGDDGYPGDDPGDPP